MAEEARNERRVLVAVDSGDESMYALSWCLNNLVFENSKDTLILLYVKPPHGVYTRLDGAGRTADDHDPHEHLFSTPDASAAAERSMEKYKKYRQEVADWVLKKAKTLCKHLQQDKVETRAEDGDPGDVICEMSRKLEPDILVMGSRSYSRVKRDFLGSVSNYCAQKVSCPVLIVKNPKSTAVDAGAGYDDIFI